MRKEVFRRSAFSALRAALAPVLLTLAVAAMIVYGLYETERASRAEALRVLEEGLLRAVVRCYAVEGSYPESVAYLEENYGVRVDSAKYAVHYDIFASNVLPEITVVELT